MKIICFVFLCNLAQPLSQFGHAGERSTHRIYVYMSNVNMERLNSVCTYHHFTSTSQMHKWRQGNYNQEAFCMCVVVDDTQRSRADDCVSFDGTINFDLSRRVQSQMFTEHFMLYWGNWNRFITRNID